ncbi:MAG: hypothetical protein J1F68_00145 [Clostridiales bacterium]|nr:hypothetical protein [Clostridiales bacterium]
MAEVSASVSLKKKIELSKGLLLIAQSADFFKEDKKLLKSLAGALNNQKKKCANSVYPMTEIDKSEVFLLVSDLGETVLKLAKVRNVSDFQVWHGRLYKFTQDLTAKIDEMDSQLKAMEGETVAAQAKKVLDKVVESAKSFGQQVSSVVDKGVEALKKNLKDED